MCPFFSKRGAGFNRFHGGVSPSHAKRTRECQVRELPVPERLILPMGQHIGAPCNPTVQVGDCVKKGQVIGDSEAFVSAPIHAPTSGKIKAIGPFASANGSRMTAVTLEADGEDAWDESLQPPQVTDLDSFLRAVRQSGLVGLGGAGFPTHVKLRAPENHPFEYLLVNAAECEPFLTVDYRAMLDWTEDFLYGLQKTVQLLRIPHVVIGVEDNKPDAIAHLREQIAHKSELSMVEVLALPSRYPQGAEKTLIYAATGRIVPAGGLPANVGCVVMNVTSLAFLGNYLQTGHPLISKNLTVDGDALAKPQNVRARIGTPISEIAEACGGLTQQPTSVLMGGPMMGIAIPDLDQPILKNNNGILFLTEDILKYEEETDCIRCGRCSQHCPMYLMPKAIMDKMRFNQTQALPDSGVLNCIECGSCAYECPAHIPLVHYMKLGKDIIRKMKR